MTSWEKAGSATSAGYVGGDDALDVVCFSHLRWDFVLQRPQHLLGRCARDHRVFFIEEPVFETDSSDVRLEVSERDNGVRVVVPHLPSGMLAEEVDRAMRALVDDLLADQEIGEYVAWYYTPMALPFSEHLQPRAVVYDCMDELSAFKNAPAVLCEREARLFELADVVFTGGVSLYEAKRDRHSNVHPFPSSIDAAHFGRAKSGLEEPADQAPIAHPRLGFFGVVDERMDLALVEGIAELRPDWQIVVVGPVVKIDPESLPKRPNIHYLGGKQYSELPAYIAGWDVAIMPFARNESTRFISPTKTPEYLAAGKPVVSTSIRDVVRPYGKLGIVEIADTPEEFVAAVERVMRRDGDDEAAWRREVEKLLSSTSWDMTWARMWQLVDAACATRAEAAVAQ